MKLSLAINKSAVENLKLLYKKYAFSTLSSFLIFIVEKKIEHINKTGEFQSTGRTFNDITTTNLRVVVNDVFLQKAEETATSCGISKSTLFNRAMLDFLSLDDTEKNIFFTQTNKKNENKIYEILDTIEKLSLQDKKNLIKLLENNLID